VNDDPTQQLKHLRSRARKLGIAIRKQPASRRTPGELYRLLDRESGELVRGDLPLVDVSTELFWIVRKRRQAVEEPGAELRPEYCPSCATRRIAYFRYCRTCGRDYEAGQTPTPRLDTRSDVLWLHEVTALEGSSRSASETVALPAQQPLISAPSSLPLEATGQPKETRRWYRSVSPPEVAVGVFLGTVIAVIATIVGARS
jgi:hypothetical protein